jgi:hypothetical protein
MFSSGGYKEFYLLGYDVAESAESQPMFYTNMSPISSGSQNKPSKNQHEADSRKSVIIYRHCATLFRMLGRKGLFRRKRGKVTGDWMEMHNSELYFCLPFTKYY